MTYSFSSFSKERGAEHNPPIPRSPVSPSPLPSIFPPCRPPDFLVIIMWLWPRYGRPLGCVHPTLRTPLTPMEFLSKVFESTRTRRMNELLGFLLCVSALLLFLALASYSPLDPSFNSASVLTESRAARNWIGIVGAYLSDIVLQFWGIGSFLLPVFLGMLGIRWFRSRAVQTPVAKTLGGAWLLMFAPALLAILPGHFRWMGAIPVEGLVGRIVGDALIHYLNVAGAYIVCTTFLAVALYLTTAFSFAAIEVWAPTRFAWVIALRDRYRDWQDDRRRRRQQLELERRRTQKPMGTTQLMPRPPAAPPP